MTWPELPEGMRVLIAGASSDIGQPLLTVLAVHGAVIGAHYFSRPDVLEEVGRTLRLPEERFRAFPGDLRTQRACHDMVDAFTRWAGGIDALVQLSGDLVGTVSWMELSEADWLADLSVNLSGPFFLAQRAMRHMEGRGGRIVFTSTASAQHGGGATSMAYGVAKAGVECLTKGLARAGAPHHILVNAVAPGFIMTKFHTLRAKRDAAALAKRAELIPLRRAGRPEDVASLIGYLLSSGGDYITGEVIPVSGGDWL